MKSYYATYASNDGGFLVGGVKEGRSSRFGSREDAALRLETVVSVNFGRATGSVMESAKHPEIFTHCGDTATCIGARCPGCRKVITLADAKAFDGDSK